MKASIVRNFLGEVSFVVNRAWRHFVWLQDAVGESDAVIILTKSGSLVDNTRTIRVSYVGVNKYPKSFILELERFNELVIAATVVDHNNLFCEIFK